MHAVEACRLGEKQRLPGPQGQSGPLEEVLAPLMVGILVDFRWSTPLARSTQVAHESCGSANPHHGEFGNRHGGTEFKIDV